MQKDFQENYDLHKITNCSPFSPMMEHPAEMAAVPPVGIEKTVLKIEKKKTEQKVIIKIMKITSIRRKFA